MSALGFDTSNYTTGVAVYCEKEYYNARKLLPVKEGERGLRQSDALFQHIKQLPEVIDLLDMPDDIKAVGVSTRPRSVEGSYMPVFLAGLSFAKTAAKVLNVPLYEFSHQDGHIMAGIISSESFELLEEEFICVHLSGGTTEVVKAKYNGYNFDAEIIGGTLDISAGQVIDRVGVSFGMKFPCGRELEKLAGETNKFLKLPVCVKDGYFNFSGLETKALGYRTENKAEIAGGIFHSIGETILKSVEYSCDKFGINKVLIVGGVASNMQIRTILNNNDRLKFYFATPELSSDNACGIAALAYKARR